MVIAYENNDEETYYFLFQCMEPKKKLKATVIDSEDIEYPIGSIVVIGTWLRR